jgi:hypothetical protein
MKRCYECGKELKFWQGYRHPAFGKKELVCSKCFDVLEESMEKYRDFILSNLDQDIEIKIDDNSIINFKHMVH